MHLMLLRITSPCTSLAPSVTRGSAAPSLHPAMQDVLSLAAEKYPLKSCSFSFSYLRCIAEKRALPYCIHPSTHQKLISTLLQDKILTSHPSTPSTGPLVHPPLHQFLYPAGSPQGCSGPASTGREGGKPGLATLAAKAHSPVLSLQQLPLSQNLLNTEGSLP